MEILKKILFFFKKKIKWFLWLFLGLVLIIFVALFLYESYEYNIGLNSRLDRLEDVSDSLQLPPESHYRYARGHVRNQKFEKAIKTLQSIKVRFPEWNPVLINKTINFTNESLRQINLDRSRLETKLNSLADAPSMESYSYEEPISEAYTIEEPVSGEYAEDQSIESYYTETDSDIPTTDKTRPTTEAPQTAFRKFEYEDRKVFPLRTSTRGYYDAIDSNYYRNLSSQEFGFRKFDFEDLRYKDNKPPKTGPPTTIQPSIDNQKKWEKRQNKSTKKK